MATLDLFFPHNVTTWAHFFFQKTPIIVPFAASLCFSCQVAKIHGKKNH
jgi:hypothetical protein